MTTMLHHVQVSCPAGGEVDVRRFYGDLLGLTEVEKPAALSARGGAWFRGEGYELHVGVEEGFTPARKAHPAFLVADAEALAHRLRGAAIEVRWDDDFPGYRRFHTHDLHGNRVEILQAQNPAGGSRGECQ